MAAANLTTDAEELHHPHRAADRRGASQELALKLPFTLTLFQREASLPWPHSSSRKKKPNPPLNHNVAEGKHTVAFKSPFHFASFACVNKAKAETQFRASGPGSQHGPETAIRDNLPCFRGALKQRATDP